MKIKKSLFLCLVTLVIAVWLESCTKNQETTKNPDNPAVVESTKPTPASSAIPKPVESLGKVDSKKSEKLTDTAKLLAGIKLDNNSSLIKLQSETAFVNHSRFLNTAWAQLEAKQLSKVRKWSGQELQSINASPRPIFYPFSGPDFLYAYSFFPQGTDYIMVGLEPVGSLPELEKLSPAQRGVQLQQLQGSLHDVLQWSFFISKEMTVELQQQGVISILLTFLARTNNNIFNVEYIGLDPKGQIQVLNNGQGKKDGKTLIPGVKIEFAPVGESKPRTLYYFSKDLSNDGMKKTPEFTQFVKQFKNPVTYLKAVSYTLHEQKYETIRNLILDVSKVVLQDDSCVPLKYFAKDKWDLHFYGTYTSPIPVFAPQFQPDLKQVYQTDKSVKPLDFGIGYKYEVNQSNMLLSISKSPSDNKP